MVLTWTEPTAEDTGPLRVEQSHRSGESFPVGVTTVEYRFYDEVNNMAVCEFNVTVVVRGRCITIVRGRHVEEYLLIH